MRDERGEAREQSLAMKETWVIVLVVTWAAFLLRLYRLDAVSLRGDEAFTVNFVLRTWEGLWKGISTIEPNPPLLYLALRAWIMLTGITEFAARYFSVFFGVLGVPLLYRLARAMFFAEKTHVLAVAAAILIAINPYQIWHSQDVRNYTMWPALSLVALIFLWRWWSAERIQTTVYRPQTIILNLVFFVLAELASLYTHYYDTFILAAANAFVIVFAVLERRWKTLARWMGAQVVLVLAYAPWVLFGTNRVTTYGEASAEQGITLLDVFSRTISVFTVGDTVPEVLRTIAWMPLTIAAAAVLIYLVRKNRASAAFLFLYIALPVLAVYIISIGRPLFLERYLNGIAPAYYLIFAVGAAALWQARVWWRTPAVILASLFFVVTSMYALASYHFDPAYAKTPPWRALMQFVVARQQPGDIVVQNFTDDAISYYRNLFMQQGTPAERQPGCDNPNGYLPVITLPKDYWPTAADEKRVRQLYADCRRIWFIPSTNDVWDPDRFIEGLLSHTADRVINTRISGYPLQLYDTPREFEPKIVPIHARVGSATLVGYRTEGVRILHVVLYWRTAQKIEKDYTVFVHLADSGDQVTAQQDNTPVGGMYPTSAWQPGELVVDGYDVHMDAAPGTYTLLVGMYDAATLARVPAFDASGTRLANDRVVLSQITIAP